MTDQTKACDWKWRDDSLIKWTNWDLGRPNDQEKHCTAIAANKKWHNISCKDRQSYVCKRKAGLVLASGFTYKVNQKRVKWADAQINCDKWGGDLVSIADADELTRVRAIVAKVELGTGSFK